MLFGIDVAGSTDELVGALAILLATVGYAGGPLIVKRSPRGPPPARRRGRGDGDQRGPARARRGAVGADADALGEALGSLVVLGLVCTALAFVLYFTLIAEVGPSRASVITYVNPVVAVALGVAILGESVTASAVAGLLLILAGSWLSTGGRPPGRLASRGATRLARRPRASRGGRRAIGLSAARAALAPHAPWTPPPGWAAADAR